MYLYHYYDASIGPFVSLSDLPAGEADAVLDNIRASKPNAQSSLRRPDYMKRRREIEEILRTEFAKKGGDIKRTTPHYMVVEHSPWLNTWFQNCAHIKIAIDEFDVKTISFTYGDAFPVYSENRHKMDDKEYRRKLYTYDEILRIIDMYGLPQEYNDDGAYGPERYVEAHIWSDETIGKYRASGGHAPV